MNRNDGEKWYLVFKDRKKTKIIVILSSVIVLLIAGIVITVIAVNKNKSKRMSIDDIDIDEVIGSEAEVEIEEQQTTMQDIVGISELQTLNYDYHAICRVYSEVDGVSPIYYIAYDATVTLGIKTEDILIDYGDEEDKEITVSLPRVGILSSTVNAGTLDYLFVDRSYNNQQTSIDAQGRCEQDLITRVRADEKMFEHARDNTEAEIRALTQPLVEQFYPDYELKIVWREN